MPNNTDTLIDVFDDIAGAINNKGVSGTMTPAQMAGKIAQIPTGGGDSALDGVLDGSIDDPLVSSCTSVKDYALLNRSYLPSVSMPSATSVGKEAFKGCISLTSASLPEATSLGNSAFYQTGLTSISLPKVTSVGTSVFQSSTSLATISMPLLTTLTGSLFYYCSNLTSLTTGTIGGVLGANCFKQCTKYTPESSYGVTEVGGGAFSYVCSSNPPATLSISFPNATKISGSDVFEYSGVTDVSMPSVTSVYQMAFRNARALKSVVLSGFSGKLDGNFFYNCTSLTSVDLGNTWFVGNIFQNCTSLPNVELRKVSQVGSNCFNGCTSLEWISFDEVTGVAQLDNVNAFTNCTSLTAIYVPDSLEASWKAATNWATFASIIKPLSQKPSA